MGKPDPWFDALYDAHAEKLVQIATYALDNRAVAEELVQDTFMILLAQKEKVKTYDHPEAFLRDVLRKRIGNEMQRAYRSREESLEPKHESYLAFEDKTERVEDILPDGLTEQDRQIIIWRAEYELPHEEIAKRLGCSTHACHAKLYRLRNKLKKLQKSKE